MGAAFEIGSDHDVEAAVVAFLGRADGAGAFEGGEPAAQPGEAGGRQFRAADVERRAGQVRRAFVPGASARGEGVVPAQRLVVCISVP